MRGPGVLLSKREITRYKDEKYLLHAMCYLIQDTEYSRNSQFKSPKKFNKTATRKTMAAGTSSKTPWTISKRVKNQPILSYLHVPGRHRIISMNQVLTRASCRVRVKSFRIASHRFASHYASKLNPIQSSPVHPIHPIHRQRRNRTPTRPQNLQQKSTHHPLAHSSSKPTNQSHPHHP
jgi:hypothetical protein